MVGGRRDEPDEEHNREIFNVQHSDIRLQFLGLRATGAAEKEDEAPVRPLLGRMSIPKQEITPDRWRCARKYRKDIERRWCLTCTRSARVWKSYDHEDGTHFNF
jgi:hypothetical protein